MLRDQDTNDDTDRRDEGKDGNVEDNVALFGLAGQHVDADAKDDGHGMDANGSKKLPDINLVQLESCGNWYQSCQVITPKVRGEITHPLPCLQTWSEDSGP